MTLSFLYHVMRLAGGLASTGQSMRPSMPRPRYSWAGIPTATGMSETREQASKDINKSVSGKNRCSGLYAEHDDDHINNDVSDVDNLYIVRSRDKIYDVTAST